MTYFYFYVLFLACIGSNNKDPDQTIPMVHIICKMGY